MGSCVSLQRNSNSAISSKREKVLIPSHTKENPIKFDHPISAGISFKLQPPSVARAAATSFEDPDSTEAAAFESQLAWFDLSECEEDFLSANGDLIASSASSPTLPGSSCICSTSPMNSPRPNGTRLADGSSPDCSEEVVEHHTILPNKQVKLVELLQDGFWSDKAKQNSKPRRVDLPSEITNRISDMGGGRTPNRNFKFEKEKTVMVIDQCGLSRLGPSFL